MTHEGRSQPPTITSSDLSPEVEQHIANLLDGYLERIERGERIDPTELQADYPEWAPILLEYIEGLQLLQHGAAGLRNSDSSRPALRPKFALNDASVDTCTAGSTDNAQLDQDDSGDADSLAVRCLGDYELIRPVARGGMGIVYEARQKSLNRRVALKVLPFAATLDRKQIVRFEHEARSAGQLHHDHIVPVYEVGSDRGIYFYAMQFIDGVTVRQLIDFLRDTILPPATVARPAEVPLTRTGDPSDLPQSDLTQPELSLPELMQSDLMQPDRTVSSAGDDDKREHAELMGAWAVLFRQQSSEYVRRCAAVGLQVAQALQAAHECGIVHRDIKPSNLLLSQYGKAWVTDFGLAVGQTPAHLTKPGELIGTLQYMSPEQTRGSTRLVDGRTDVYSLGVTLYELLSLKAPFDEASQPVVMHRIETGSYCRLRNIAPWVPRELEYVVLKAMAVNPEDRYGSAEELADDLQRFLAGRSPLARPFPFWHRVRRWCERNRWLVAAGVAGLAAHSLISTSLVLWGARQNQLQQRALRQSAAYLEEARSAIEHFGLRAAELLGNTPATHQVRQAILRDVLDYHRRLLAQSTDSPQLKFDVALAYGKIGKLESELGDLESAAKSLNASEQLWRELQLEQPQRPEHSVQLARCLNQQASVFQQLNRSEDALRTYQTALAVQSPLCDAWPGSTPYRVELARTWNNLGMLQASLGRDDDAETAYQSALERLRSTTTSAGSPTAPTTDNQLGLDDFDSLRTQATTLNNLSVLFQQSRPEQSRPEQSRAHAEESLKIRQQLLRQQPDNTEVLTDLAGSYNNLATLAASAGDLSTALENYQSAIEIQTQLTARAPLVLNARRDLAATWNNLGLVYHRQQAWDRAEEAFRKAMDLQVALLRQAPTEADHSRLGGVYNNLASIYKQLGDWERATQYYGRGIRQTELAFRGAPDVAEHRDFLSRTLYNSSEALRHVGRLEEAVQQTVRRRELWPDDSDQLVAVADELRSAWILAAADNQSLRSSIVQQIAVTLKQVRNTGKSLANTPAVERLRTTFADYPEILELLSQDVGQSTQGPIHDIPTSSASS
ncbi:MAG: serine/threonine-protein kinase [Pirellulales bacterium]